MFNSRHRSRARRPAAPAVAVCLGLLVLAGAASGQQRPERDTVPALTESLGRLGPGSVLRLRMTAGGELAGPLGGVAHDALLLGERRVLLRDIDAVWRRDRQTRRGATIGGLVAGGAGLAWFGFFGLALVGEGTAGGEIIPIVAGGTLLSVAGGAAFGAAIGATQVRWLPVWTRPGVVARPAAAAVPAVAGVAVPGRRFAAFEGAVAYGRSGQDGGTDGGLGARVGLLSEYGTFGTRGGVRPFLAFGPEIGTQRLGSTGIREAYRFRSECDEQWNCETVADTIMVRRVYSMADAGALLRAGLDAGVAAPYVALGTGLQARRVTSATILPSPVAADYAGSHYVMGYSAGAGVQLRPGIRGFGVNLEGRWRSNVFPGQSDGIDEVFGYWTVSAVLSRSW
jgi:hypothetical protein